MYPVPPARENILILCRATPEESEAHGTIVCVAGLTDHDEFRRLYPVPFKPFTHGGGIQFHKKQWVEASLSPPDDKRDQRPESRRIDIATVRVGAKEDDDSLRSRLQRVLSPSIASIQAGGASLGIIRPKLLDYDFAFVEEEREAKQLRFDPEGFLVKGSKVRLPQRSRYLFTCEQPSDCTCSDTPHHMQILDWEANELFRSVTKNTEDRVHVVMKMRERLFDWMRTRDLFLMMGTHHRWKNWLIVSILYLRPLGTP